MRKTFNSIVNHTCHLTNTTFPEYDFHGDHASPSEIWIFYDGDDPDSKDPTLQNNDYPDPGDNHGAAGENVALADGHVEWSHKRITSAVGSWKRRDPRPH